MQKRERGREVISPDITESDESSSRTTSALKNTRCINLPIFMVKSGEGFDIKTVL